MISGLHPEISESDLRAIRREDQEYRIENARANGDATCRSCDGTGAIGRWIQQQPRNVFEWGPCPECSGVGVDAEAMAMRVREALVDQLDGGVGPSLEAFVAYLAERNGEFIRDMLFPAPRTEHEVIQRYQQQFADQEMARGWQDVDEAYRLGVQNAA